MAHRKRPRRQRKHVWKPPKAIVAAMLWRTHNVAHHEHRLKIAETVAAAMLWRTENVLADNANMLPIVNSLFASQAHSPQTKCAAWLLCSWWPLSALLFMLVLPLTVLIYANSWNRLSSQARTTWTRSSQRLLYRPSIPLGTPCSTQTSSTWRCYH